MKPMTDILFALCGNLGRKTYFQPVTSCGKSCWTGFVDGLVAFCLSNWAVRSLSMGENVALPLDVATAADY